MGGSSAWRERGSRARPRFKIWVSLSVEEECGLVGPSSGFWKLCHLLPFWSFKLFIFHSLVV